ncbi:29795_t:CDS:2 [Racocetra persica]|uniref:29795_t:CDS:1 n=1 Tax=Racocetra persica TaxID=160502 RepID=A0ACA9KMU5_9GLOM|nr:29795_t:CDS:2 [Racocetra persica]
MKHNKSSTRKDRVLANKRRNTIEHFKNIPHHSHQIKDSDLIKTPEIIRQMVTQEASKPYTPTSIVTTIKVRLNCFLVA